MGLSSVLSVSYMLCLSSGCATASKRQNSPQKGGRRGCVLGPGGTGRLRCRVRPTERRESSACCCGMGIYQGEGIVELIISHSFIGDSAGLSGIVDGQNGDLIGKGEAVDGVKGVLHLDAYYSSGEHDVRSIDCFVGPGNELHLVDNVTPDAIVSLDQSLIFIPKYRYENPGKRTSTDWLGGIFLIRAPDKTADPKEP